jgi:hypothetical protein
MISKDKLRYLVYKRNVLGKKNSYTPVAIVTGINGATSTINRFPPKQRKMIGYFATHKTRLKEEEIKSYTKSKILYKFSQNISFV